MKTEPGPGESGQGKTDPVIKCNDCAQFIKQSGELWLPSDFTKLLILQSSNNTSWTTSQPRKTPPPQAHRRVTQPSLHLHLLRAPRRSKRGRRRSVGKRSRLTLLTWGMFPTRRRSLMSLRKKSWKKRFRVRHAISSSQQTCR